MTRQAELPIVVPVGANRTTLWGLSPRERLRRIAAARALHLSDAAEGRAWLRVDMDYAFDPFWLGHAARHPGLAITRDGMPIIAHLPAGATDPTTLETLAQETSEIGDTALRKRDRPFIERLTFASAPAIERISYRASYKGVTDLLTKYLWPEWAFHLTRLAAKLRISPNMVTTIGAIFCVIATIAFRYGWYVTGILTGLVMMVLDTVDGKLARCTITSSKWGNVFDHGMDLVHPPFWWWGWGVGLAAYGRPLSDDAFRWCMIAILGGYVVQRLIEGVFMRRFGFHIHVWRRIDSRFRLITARRNPNMVILTASVIVARPDLGLEAVAWWTVICLVVHAVQLVQAELAKAKGVPIRSWLE